MVTVSGTRTKDCFACRMVSGAGLFGIGGYLGYYARKNNTKSGKLIISALSATFIFMSLARFSQTYPFDKGVQKRHPDT